MQEHGSGIDYEENLDLKTEREHMILSNRKINRALNKMYKEVPNKNNNNTNNNYTHDKAAVGQGINRETCLNTCEGSTQAVEAISALDMSDGAVIPDYPP